MHRPGAGCFFAANPPFGILIGQSLSHYKILSELGRGGMGIVYKAEDTKLDRTVAIKVLPSSALASEDDRTRFYREAKAAAQLQHPHIASVFEIDEAAPSDAPHGTQASPFIAMEFIDGETLQERIKAGPLKLEEAVRIASEIASALEAAHEKDIVHRDIKSANVMLTAKGVAKVLDFGLAQTAASTKLTKMGSTVGTVAYMSPEQARGEEVDGRSDIYSLGTVLYEMIAGRAPFAGDYEQAVVYSILNTNAEPLTAIRSGVPMEMERVVVKALEKDREYRYQSAADLISDLKSVERALDHTSTGETGRMSQVVSPSRTGPSAQSGIKAPSADETPSRPTLWRSVAGILALLLAGLLWAFFKQTGSSENRAIFASLELPAGVVLEPGKSAPLDLSRSPVAISPNGNVVAIVGSYRETTSIYVRRMDRAQFERFAGTEGAYGVEFSPDGSNIAYFANNRLHVVSTIGGASREIASVSLPSGIVWFDENRILTANNESEDLEVLDVIAGSRSAVNPTLDGGPFTRSVSPRTRLSDNTVLLTGFPHTPGTFILDVNAATVERIDRGITERMFSTKDYLVFAEGSGLSVIQSTGIENIRSGPTATISSQVYTRDIPYFDADEFGRVVYVEGPNGDYREFVWLTDDGNTESLGLGVETFGTFKLSPDGQSLAAVVYGVSGSELWIFDLLRGGSRTNIATSGNPDLPTWSRDGSKLYFTSRTLDEPSVAMVADVGTGATAQVVNAALATVDWVSPNDIYLGGLYHDGVQKAGYFDLEAQETNAFPYYFPTPLSRMSHSGTHVAFTTNKTGDYEIFVQPFPPDGGEWKVETGGGEEPVWGANDEYLYFRNGDNLYRIDASLNGERPTFGVVDTLFTEPFENPGGYSFDVSSADGRVLLLRTPLPFPEITSIKLVVNVPALIGNN
ncbi:MAG: serine/threonine protein kinase/Tol biopolymer transport system component [Rhodothermales bacterium]